jgi:hypothetical protein
LSGVAYVRMSRSYKEQGAASDLDVVLRQAKNNAVSANAPSFVEIDVEGRRIIPWSYRTVGLWHFEHAAEFGKSPGIHNHDARIQGGEIKPGKIGNGVHLKPDACVDLSADPDFDLDDGGYLEAYVLPAVSGYGGDSYIFSKLGSYSLKIDFKGHLVGEAGGTTVKAKDYRIVSLRWTKVAFAWDGQSTRLFVDDALVAHGKGAHPPITDHPLLIGAESGNLVGIVDEVRVMALDKGRALELPPQFKIEHTCAPWSGVYFAPDGSLDLRYHAGPVSVSLVQENRVRTVTISMMGATSRLELDKREVAQDDTQQQPAQTGTKSQNINFTDPNGKVPDSTSGSSAPKKDPKPAYTGKTGYAGSESKAPEEKP